MKPAALTDQAAHEIHALAFDADDGGPLARFAERLEMPAAEARTLGIGTVRAKPGGDGRWQHDEAGVRSLTLPVFKGDTHLDIIAFPAGGGRGLSLTDLVAGFFLYEQDGRYGFQVVRNEDP